MSLQPYRRRTVPFVFGDEFIEYGRRSGGGYSPDEAIDVILDRYYAMTFPAASREVAEAHCIRAFILIRAMGHLCGCHQRLNGRSSIPESGLAL